jgi:glycosyltransferase involved in cell wall biosynthesis
MSLSSAPTSNHNIKPTVSVILPCFNAEGTLEKALLSMSNQRYQDFEIITVDDGSTDSTAQALKDWRKRDSRIRIIEQEHQGIIRSLNTGIRHSQAPFIARMDADDYSHPHRIEKQVAFLENNPQISMVGCQVEMFPKDKVQGGYRRYVGWLNRLIRHEQITREIFIESPFAHPSVLIRRAAFELVGGYEDHGWPEDYDLWLRMYLAGIKFGKVPEVLFSWREHPGRITRTDSRYSVENFIRAKTHYLCRGPLADRDAVIVWGAGQMGRRISKHLLRNGAPIVAFIDIDPKKIGRTLRSRPIYPVEDVLPIWNANKNPALLAAVGSQGARELIREQLARFGLSEGSDWWAVA